MFLRNSCFSKSFSEKTQKPTTFKRLYRVTDVFLELFQTFYRSFSAEHPQDVASVQMHETQNRKVFLTRSVVNNVTLKYSCFGPIEAWCCHHIETSQLICTADQLIVFYVS